MGFSAKRRRAVADQNKYFSRVDRSRLQSNRHPPPMARRDSPARWPADIRYLRAFLFHASATPAVRDFVKGDASLATSLPNTYPSSVAIRPITDPTHPAHGQYGLFATCRIKPNTRILDYFGTVSQHSSQFMTTLKTNISQAKYIAIHDLTRIMISPFTGFPTARA